MIEVYGFLAVFLVQVLAMSVFFPARVGRYIRRHAHSLPQERLAQLYPGVDLERARERFIGRFRAVNACIAVLGLSLLAWLIDHMRHPGWDHGLVIGLSALYYLIQIVPLLFISWLGFKVNRAFRRSWLEPRRTATLQRRGLFDYVSPVAVFLAAAAYVAIVPFIIFMQQEPTLGYLLIAVLTLTYLMQGWVIYRSLYGKKTNPLEAPEVRTHRIHMTAKTGVYGLIVVTLFFAFVFLVDLWEMKHWVPLAQTVCLLASTVFCFMGISAAPGERDSGDADSAPAPAPHR